MSAERARTRWPSLARWLHTYVSMIGFGALLIASITGITLNHAEFFEREATHDDATGTLPQELLPAPEKDADSTALAAGFRAHHDP